MIIQLLKLSIQSITVTSKMFALALTRSVSFVNCPKHRNNKKKYKLNNQQIFDRNRRILKSTWDSKNKKEYHSRKSIKTNQL